MSTLYSKLNQISIEPMRADEAEAALARVVKETATMSELSGVLGVEGGMITALRDPALIKHRYDEVAAIINRISKTFGDEQYIIQAHLNKLKSILAKSIEVVYMAFVDQSSGLPSVTPAAGAGGARPTGSGQRKREYATVPVETTINVTNAAVRVDGDLLGKLMVGGSSKIMITGRIGPEAEIVMRDYQPGYIIIRGEIDAGAKISTKRQSILLCSNVAGRVSVSSDSGNITNLKEVGAETVFQTNGTVTSFGKTQARRESQAAFVLLTPEDGVNNSADESKTADNTELTLRLSKEQQAAILKKSGRTGRLSIDPANTTALALTDGRARTVKDLDASTKAPGSDSSLFESLISNGKALKAAERAKEAFEITRLQRVLKRILTDAKEKYLASYSVLGYADNADIDRAGGMKKYRELIRVFNSDHLSGVSEATTQLFTDIFRLVNDAKSHLLSGDESRLKYQQNQCDEFSLYRWIVDGSQVLRDILTGKSTTTKAPGERAKDSYADATAEDADIHTAGKAPADKPTRERIQGALNSWVAQLFKLNCFAEKYKFEGTKLFGALNVSTINLGFLRYQYSQVVEVLEFMGERTKGLKELPQLEGRKTMALGFAQKLLGKFDEAYKALVAERNAQISAEIETASFAGYASLHEALMTEHGKGILYVTQESLAAQYTRDTWNKLLGVIYNYFSARAGSLQQNNLGVDQHVLDPIHFDKPYNEIINCLIFNAPINDSSIRLAALATRSMGHLGYFKQIELFCSMAGLRDFDIATGEHIVLVEPGKISILQFMNFINSIYPGDEAIAKLKAEPYKMFDYLSWGEIEKERASVIRLIRVLEKIMSNTALASYLSDNPSFKKTSDAFSECATQLIATLRLSISAPGKLVTRPVAPVITSVPAPTPAPAPVVAVAGARVDSASGFTTASGVNIIWDDRALLLLHGPSNTVNLGKLEGFRLARVGGNISFQTMSRRKPPVIVDTLEGLPFKNISRMRVYKFEADFQDVVVNCDVRGDVSIIVSGDDSNLLLTRPMHGRVLCADGGILALDLVAGKLITQQGGAILVDYEPRPDCNAEINGDFFLYSQHEGGASIGKRTLESKNTVILNKKATVEKLSYGNAKGTITGDGIVPGGYIKYVGSTTSIVDGIACSRIGHIGTLFSRGGGSHVNVINSTVKGSVINGDKWDDDNSFTGGVYSGPTVIGYGKATTCSGDVTRSVYKGPEGSYTETVDNRTGDVTRVWF
ncbi:MAG: hypothetical protein P1U40_04140 [Coxiellaceae bacterium]|nr:hypothetical protein [Coxiellaceae bacterium]